ncbi:hypothetical protein JCM10450v2_007666 [Rhodotorula kratochvilovae]
MPADRSGSAGSSAWPANLDPAASSSSAAARSSHAAPLTAPGGAYPGPAGPHAPPTPVQAYHDPPAAGTSASAPAYSHDLPHPHLAHTLGHAQQQQQAPPAWFDRQSSSHQHPHPHAQPHPMQQHAHYPPSQGLQIDTGRPLWQDDGRRKSLKLANGDDGAAGAAVAPLSQWQWPGAGNGAAETRRASGDHGGLPLHHHQQQQHDGSGSAAGMLPSPVVPGAVGPSSWPPAHHFAGTASHYYPSLPHPFGAQPSAPPGSSDGRPGSSSSAYPTPYSSHTGLPGSAGGLPPTYVPYGAPAPGGYLPYTPTSSSFPPSAYTPMFSHTTPAAAAFASTSSLPQQQTLAHASSAYSQQPYSAYLPTPRSHFPPTPTVPPQAALAYGAVGPAGSATDSPTAPTFPTDASTPYIPADPSAPPAAVVLVAAANRTKLGTIDLTGHTRPDEVSARRPSTAQSTRRAVDLVYDCQNCRRKIGRLTLRGGAVEKPVGDNASKYLGVFYCTSCVAPPPMSASGARSDSISGTVSAYSTEATYHDTLSAAVDRYQGLDPTSADTRPPPAAPGKVRSGFTAHAALAAGSGAGKKRRASVADESEGVLACDVCRRDLATGTLQLVATGEAVGATIEVLCAHCESRYTRCSDCGGGGGSKGVGRWRCTQMFPPGRRTCMLQHTRVGTVNEMDYDVWPISSIGAEQVPEIIDLCKDLYYTNLLGTLGVPDMLESVSPIARSFVEVEKLCVDSWTYLALRWVRPSSRKKRSKKNSTGAATSNGGSGDTGANSSPEESGKAELAGGSLVDSPKSDVPLVREGKVLTGFIIAELDLNWGSLHVAITLPTGAGESYDASTRLMQTLVARVHEDLAATNAHRATMQLPLYPSVTTAWTMHMTKRDSRIMSRLETRRGFIPLEDFLVKYPETDVQRFAPHRKAYMPPEFLRGWQVYAKRLTQDDLPPSNSSSLASNTSSSSNHQMQQQMAPGAQPQHPRIPTTSVRRA